MKILSFLMDENGQLSMIRMLAFMMVLSYIAQDIGAAFFGMAKPDLQSLVATLTAIGFKLVQKPFEKANGKE
jgi:hypothetical protein